MIGDAGLGERVDPGEERSFARIVSIIEATLRRDHARAGGTAQRDQHPKHHGLVRAELEVARDLPPDLRAGIFREPGRRYDAWVRFSNGAAKVQPDAVPDGRGMAIKVLGVDGPKLLEDEANARTQDFLLVNTPSFFVRNAADYVELFQALDAGKPLRFFFPSLNPLRWRLTEFQRAKASQRRISNPLGAQYWTTVPIAMGGRPARMSARPRELAPPPRQVPASPDFLREAMTAQLERRPAVFDFLVQLQTDPARMPVEDPTVTWDERRSPYRPVAALTIPPQRFDFPEQLALAEHLSFTPWHAIAEHRPLGSVNRCRKPVYRAIQELRHSLNGVPRREPEALQRFG